MYMYIVCSFYMYLWPLSDAIVHRLQLFGGMLFVCCREFRHPPYLGWKYTLVLWSIGSTYSISESPLFWRFHCIYNAQCTCTYICTAYIHVCTWIRNITAGCSPLDCRVSALGLEWGISVERRQLSPRVREEMVAGSRGSYLPRWAWVQSSPRQEWLR